MSGVLNVCLFKRVVLYLKVLLIRNMPPNLQYGAIFYAHRMEIIYLGPLWIALSDAQGLNELSEASLPDGAFSTAFKVWGIYKSKYVCRWWHLQTLLDLAFVMNLSSSIVLWLYITYLLHRYCRLKKLQPKILSIAWTCEHNSSHQWLCILQCSV